MADDLKFRCLECAGKVQVPSEWAGRRIKCPRCKNITFVPGTRIDHIDEDVLHKALTEEQQSESSIKEIPYATAVDIPNTKCCPYCNGEVPQVAQKCKHCGEWLQSRTSDAMLSSRTDHAPTSVPLKTVVIIILILLVGGWFWSEYGDDIMHGSTDPPVIAKETIPDQPPPPPPPPAPIPRKLTEKELIQIVRETWGSGRAPNEFGVATFLGVERSNEISFPYVLKIKYAIPLLMIAGHGEAVYKIPFDEELNLGDGYTRINGHYEIYDHRAMATIAMVMSEARSAIVEAKENLD